MTAIVRRGMSAVSLATWGAILTYFYVTRRVNDYLHPTFQIYVFLAGLVLLAMAAGTLLFPAEHTHEGEECCGHEHDRIRFSHWVAFFVLTVPVVVATIVSPSQFSATIVENRGIVSTLDGLPGAQARYAEPPLPGSTDSGEPVNTGDYLSRSADGVIQAEAVDLLYAAEDADLRKDFDGKEVEMVGQYMPAKANNPTGNRFNLIRMFVVCCAADARPLGIAVESTKSERPAEMSWLRIRGKATFPVEGGRPTPVIEAQSIEPAEPPEESFIY